MKFDLKVLLYDELSYKKNHINFSPNTKIAIKPQIARQQSKLNENDKLYRIALSFKIASTAEEPQPFDMNVTLVGIFEAELANPNEERAFIIEGTKILYPYFRAAVANQMSSAFVPPINLPVVSGAVFPEDRDVYAFSVDSNLN